jgi:hypothetical protein
LKEFLAEKVLTRLDDSGNAPVLDFHHMFLAALATKLKFDFCAAREKCRGGATVGFSPVAG